MQAAIVDTANLMVIEGEADELIVVDGRVTGIRLGDGRELGPLRRRDHGNVFCVD